MFGPLKACFALIGIVGLLSLPTACTYHARKITKAQVHVAERSRELVAAARSANEIGSLHLTLAETQLAHTNLIATSNSLAGAGEAYDLSGDFLRRDQNLIGLPTLDQSKRVENLLTNAPGPREEAQEGEQARETQETRWRAKVEANSARLIALGIEAEAEKNQNVVKRVWRGTFSTLGIGGIVALCIFFPALIPILIRMVAWVVGKLPRIAGAVGVASTKIVDQVVSGIDQAKDEFKKNRGKSYTGDEILEILRSRLSENIDTENAGVIDARRQTLGK